VAVKSVLNAEVVKELESFPSHNIVRIEQLNESRIYLGLINDICLFDCAYLVD
jgi:hypothetical protein